MSYRPPAHLPTDEQVEALTLVGTGDDVALEALAGTGKTTTLKMVAAQRPRARILYCAFNRSIVEEGRATFPDHVECRTAHSLAYGAVGWRYKHRFGPDARRLTSREIASRLRIPHKVHVDTSGGGTFSMPAFQVAGYVHRTIEAFCQTDAAEPTTAHVPRVMTLDGPGETENNVRFAEQIQPWVQTAWADLQSVDGLLRFTPTHYLKLWQLTNPTLDYDMILFDEAQDADPVMAAVVGAQRAQTVYVGDTRQQIYEWRGAVNALERFQVAHRAWLTNSFRFGPAIAEAANRWLHEIQSPKMVAGRGGPSVRGPVPLDHEDQVILTRTNAIAIQEAMWAIENGGKPKLVGDTQRDFIRFAEAALQLQNGQLCAHPELACFTSWDEVVRYSEEDMLGGDLEVSVRVVETWGAGKIIDLLRKCAETEAEATVVISTAHKAKGREWDAVTLTDDFRTPDDPDDDRPITPGEYRLNYVAVTRAKSILDDRTISRADDEAA